jgi:hypothetical protein
MGVHTRVFVGNDFFVFIEEFVVEGQIFIA